MTEDGEKFVPYEERSEDERRFHDESTVRPKETEPAAFKLSRAALIGAESLNTDPNFSPRKEYGKYLEEQQEDAINRNVVYDENIREGKFLQDIGRRIAVKILTEIATHPERKSFDYSVDSSVMGNENQIASFISRLESITINYVKGGLLGQEDGDGFAIDDLHLESIEGGSIRITVELPQK